MRRALRTGAIAVAALGAAVATLAAPVAAGSSPAVAVLPLPRADGFDAIAVVGGRLILSGGRGGSLFTSASDALGALDCDAATVDVTALTLTDVSSGNCDDPTLYGVRTLVVNSFINGNPDGGNVQIASATPAGTALGPTVMTYTELSDTDAEWVYGDGSLWLYDNLTTQGSELLRISATTGAVLQTIAMPDIDRPLIAADADGFWITLATNSGGPGLYHVAPGMTQPTFVRPMRDGAIWMLASRHSLWVEVNHGRRHATLLRYDGTRLALAVDSGPSPPIAEGGYGERKVVGGSAGIWTVSGQQALRIDPATGRVTARVGVPGAYGQPTPVLLDGALFVLESPKRLYRIRLPG